MFVTVRGHVVELTRGGARVKRSPYAGLRAGPVVNIARSYSNAGPASPRRLDYLPPALMPR